MRGNGRSILMWAAFLLAVPSSLDAKAAGSPVQRFMSPLFPTLDDEFEKARSDKLASIVHGDGSSTHIMYRIPSKFSNIVSHFVVDIDEYTYFYLMKKDKLVLDFDDQNGSWGYISGDRLEIFVVDYPLDPGDVSLGEFGREDYDYEYVIIGKAGIRAYHCQFDLSKISRWKSVQKLGPSHHPNPFPAAILKYLYDGGGMGTDRCTDFATPTRGA